MHYDHKNIDKKWQDRWEESGVFHAEDFSPKPKFYCLIEFPYPSGAGLHVGHPRSYTALDVLARKRRMQGYNVLYPIGWDAFGLPAENYAIKTGRKPQDVTAENIATFKRQIQSLGISFDWSREVNTTDPAYYKWTQWQFLQFFKAGMAYKDTIPINWCLSCKIGLANEEVVNGACERCGGEVEKRDKEQWMIAITKYADRLIKDLEGLDYLPKIAKQQVDWIGRSEGATVRFAVDGVDAEIEVFTTRPDTLFGATYMVVAPEYVQLDALVTDEQKEAVEAYKKEAAAKTDIERGDATREKTGVFTGSYAINPANGKKMPIWVADYVLAGYGTGAIMAVPAHDERDYAFAKAFDLPIIPVIQAPSVQMPASTAGIAVGKLQEEVNLQADCWTGDGTLINSEFLNGKDVATAKADMIAWLEEQGIGGASTNYRLRDWVFSRQRYWGEPIPLVHCESVCSPETNGWVAVPDEDLPVVLPEVEKYEPTDTGESPLAAIDAWVNTTCPTCGGAAKRETDTMPNWAGSSWYFLRYIDPHNAEQFADSAKLKYWMPVDWYNGGMEHTTLHLLYSRFWNKFLADQGHVPVSEPYAKRTSHGMILAEGGGKMSKSRGNVVNPDDIVQQFGADTLRVYEMFIGPFGEAAQWSENGVIGVKRFLDKISRMPDIIATQEAEEVTRELHRTIKKVTEDIDSMGFNTAVAQMMQFVNLVTKHQAITRASFLDFLRVLTPFAPHLANELAESIQHREMMEKEEWPSFDESLLVNEVVTIAIQVNGKLRGSIEVDVDTAETDILRRAKEQENVARYLADGIKKEIYIKNKLVNFVV